LRRPIHDCGLEIKPGDYGCRVPGRLAARTPIRHETVIYSPAMVIYAKLSRHPRFGARILLEVQ